MDDATRNRAVKLTAGEITVDVDPDAGGRVAQITVGTTPLLVPRDHPEAMGAPLAWGAYPMVPWAGRIRNGRFEFRGTAHQLPRNHQGHAMHGTGFVSPWTVADRSDRQATLGLELPTDDRWPFGGSAEQVLTVEPDAVRFELSVTAHDRAFPVSFGWHPWFRKPDRLDFSPAAMYRRDDESIAVDELVPVPTGPWDDCFVNHEPVRLSIDGIELEITSPCTDWVVFSEPDHATCIEPQTAPPDAFNIGAAVLEQGERSTAAWQLRIVSQRSQEASSSPVGVTGR